MMTASPAETVSITEGAYSGCKLTGSYVFPVAESTRIRNNAFTREQIILARRTAQRFPGSHSEGANTVGISKSNDTEPGEHGDARVRALALFHESANGREDVLLIDPELSRLLQIVCEYVEQQLRVRGCVDVSVRGRVHELEQRCGVDQVTVLDQNGQRQFFKFGSFRCSHMRKYNAIRRVDIEWLRLRVM